MCTSFHCTTNSLLGYTQFSNKNSQIFVSGHHKNKSWLLQICTKLVVANFSMGDFYSVQIIIEVTKFEANYL